MSLTGKVFEIQQYCINDGPGIRTNVFLKGCPIRCPWCCNPESQSYKEEMGFYSRKCIGCGMCEKNCSQQNIALENPARIKNRVSCQECEDRSCLKYCPSEALKLYGEDMTVDEVMAEVRKDIPFYERSGGGVTASGGEALMQHEFVRELFVRCKEENITTAIETCGCVPWEAYANVLDVTDYFLCDIKHVDKEKFKSVTGGNLELILSNFEKLLKNGKNVEVRIPLIPDFNSDEETFRQICLYLKEQQVSHVTVLPFHKLGLEKYKSLNRKYPYGEKETLSKETLDKIQKIAGECGMECSLYRN